MLPKGPYLPCVSIAGRALLAGYHRYNCWFYPFISQSVDLENINVQCILGKLPCIVGSHDWWGYPTLSRMTSSVPYRALTACLQGCARGLWKSSRLFSAEWCVGGKNGIRTGNWAQDEVKIKLAHHFGYDSKTLWFLNMGMQTISGATVLY